MFLLHYAIPTIHVPVARTYHLYALYSLFCRLLACHYPGQMMDTGVRVNFKFLTNFYNNGWLAASFISNPHVRHYMLPLIQAAKAELDNHFAGNSNTVSITDTDLQDFIYALKRILNIENDIYIAINFIGKIVINLVIITWL